MEILRPDTEVYIYCLSDNNPDVRGQSFDRSKNKSMRELLANSKIEERDMESAPKFPITNGREEELIAMHMHLFAWYEQRLRDNNLTNTW